MSFAGVFLDALSLKRKKHKSSKKAQGPSSPPISTTAAPPGPGVNALSANESADEANVNDNAVTPQPEAESSQPLAETVPRWEGCRDPILAILSLLKEIHEGTEHVVLLKNLCEGLLLICKIIQVLDQDDNTASLHGSIGEHKKYFDKQIKRMEDEDAAPDPDSPLIKPIQLYAKELGIILAALVKYHHPVDGEIDHHYKALKTLLESKGVWNSEDMMMEGCAERFAAIFKQLKTLIEMYMETDPSFSRQGLSDVEPALANHNEFESKSLSKNPTSGGGQHATCLPGTREEILAEIEEWGRQDATESRVFCIMDMAGTGKSTIANHVAQKLGRERRLVARFFFSRGNAGTAAPSDLCVSMAREMEIHHPELEEGIEKTLGKKDTVFSLPLATQWEMLVANHAFRLKGGPYFFVIDALDECIESDRQTLLECLLKSIDAATPFDPDLRLLLTTRPEGDITALLDEDGGTIVSRHRILRRLDGGSVDLYDVSKYIHHRLRNISQLIVSPERREQLVKRSEGLFIFASTACSMICQTYDPRSALQHILSSKDSSLDGLYQEVLRMAVPNDDASLALLRQVLGVILVVARPLSQTSLSELFGHVGQAPVGKIIRGLGSVLGSGGKDDPVYILHPTFREFLLQRRRSTLYAVSSHAGHRLLATACLKELNSKLGHDISLNRKLQESLSFSSSEESKRVNLRRETMCYATTHWIIHASHALHLPAMRALVLELFVENLLSWLELESFLEGIGAAIQSIVYLKVQQEKQLLLRDSLEVCSTAFDLHNWCKDIIQFSDQARRIWGSSTMNLYSSAMIYWQCSGPIFTYYVSRKSEERPMVRLVVEEKRGSTSSVPLHGHSKPVLDIDFSPNGQNLASCAMDDTIRVWNTYSGLQEAELNLPEARSLAYLSTGMELVVATRNGSFHRFNLECKTFVAINANVKISECKIRVSPQDTFALCGTMDGQLLTIDLRTDTVQSLIQAHIKGIASVDISADGALFASSTWDGAIRLWSRETAYSNLQPLFTFSCINRHCSPGHRIALLPESRTLAACSLSQLHLWSIDNGASISDHSIEAKWPPTLSNGGHYLAMAISGSLQLHNAMTGEVLFKFENAVDPLEPKVVFSKDGNIVAASRDAAISIWDVDDILANGKKKSRLCQGASDWSFSDDYQKLAQIVSVMDHGYGVSEQQLTIWDLLEGRKLAESKMLTRPWRTAVSFSPSGRFIVCAGRDHIELRNGSSGELITDGLFAIGLSRVPFHISVSPCETLVSIVSQRNILTDLHSRPYGNTDDTVYGEDSDEGSDKDSDEGSDKEFEFDKDDANGDSGDKLVLWEIRHGQSLIPVHTIALSPSPLFSGPPQLSAGSKKKREIVAFDRQGRHLLVEDMVWDVSQRPPLQLSQTEAALNFQEFARPCSRLRWDHLYSRLEFRRPPVEYYRAHPNWTDLAYYIDGDVAVVSAKQGEFVVLDFRHMVPHAQEDVQEAADSEESEDY